MYFKLRATAINQNGRGTVTFHRFAVKSLLWPVWKVEMLAGAVANEGNGSAVTCQVIYMGNVL